MAIAKKTEEVIEIRPIEIKKATVRIVGDTPLIMHAWSSKAKRMMLEAQTGKAKGKKTPVKRPAADFCESMYWMTGAPEYDDNTPDEEVMERVCEAIENGATFGFPVTAIKQAAQSGAYRLGWVKNQMEMRGAFFIEGDERGLVQVHSDAPVLKEDMVRIGQGKADIRYRGEFRNWYMDLSIAYNASGNISLENIINAINAGGFTVGIGEWRPEKDGSYGTFHVSAK